MRVTNVSDHSYYTIMNAHLTPSSESPAGGACGGGAAHSVCPWWLGHLLASPIRRLVENPERLLGPFVRPGMTVLEPGCGMGFFSLPLARMVGPQGTVVCVDLQPKMVAGLLRRARRAGIADRIKASACSSSDLGLASWAGRIDLALAIHMVHEVPDKAGFLGQLHAALKPGGRLLIREPAGHVTPDDLEATLATADRAGFRRVSVSSSRRSLSAIVEVPGTPA
jgi:2-polyprenyl-3-methyl-5-hydroxy-6-metoxy-1,4-benzoquinol methylase